MPVCWVIGYGTRLAARFCKTDGCAGGPDAAASVRYYAKFDLLILDEVGFDRLERIESPQAASLLYKLINVRGGRSTALVTNIDFDGWGNYWGDPPLAMAFLDRVVDGAIIMKINGKSYRAYRAEQASAIKRPKK